MNESDPSARPQINLLPEPLAAAFPFHLAVDRELRLLQVGSALSRICPAVRSGSRLMDLFRLVRPEGELTFAAVAGNRARIVVLEDRASPLLLRGEFQLLPPGDRVVFLGSRWFTKAAPQRILLVDDTVANLRMLTLMLQRDAHVVRLATNVWEAETCCRAERFDVVFMDLHMPEVDGFEATRRLRALEATQGHRAQIIALTADARAEFGGKCSEAGMDGMMSKPVRIAQINEFLASLPASGSIIERP